MCSVKDETPLQGNLRKITIGSFAETIKNETLRSLKHRYDLEVVYVGVVLDGYLGQRIKQETQLNSEER